MKWSVFVLCSLIIISSAKCSNGEKCGINNEVNVTVSQACMNKYNSLKISQYFGNQNFEDCGLFFTSQFTDVSISSWNNSFVACTDIDAHPYLSMNIIIHPGSGSLHLQSTTCFTSNSTIRGVCECRMDCLLEFTPSGAHPFKYFIYLVDIGCNADTLSSALLVYNNASNVYPHIQKKPDNLSCPLLVLSPVNSVLPLTLTSNLYFSTLSMTPIPTATSITNDCSPYTISQITGSESYCTSVCPDQSSTYSALLHKACTDPNSMSNWFIKPAAASTIDFASFSQCAIATDVVPLKELFRSPSPLCSNSMMVVDWQLSNASCDCGCHGSGNAPSTSSCVLQFTNRDTNIQDIVVFSSGWNTEERGNLEMLLNSCSVELQLSNCSKMPFSSDIVVTATPTTTEVSLPVDPLTITTPTLIGILVLGITSIICVIFVFTMAISIIFRHRQKRRNMMTMIEDEVQHMKEIPNQYRNCESKFVLTKTLSQFLIEPADIKLIEKVGQGEFGVVYRGLWATHKQDDLELLSVAVKTLKKTCFHFNRTDELIQEAEKMVQFDHLNVLSLTGVCVGLLESPCIVMPFMSNGSLLSYLRKEAADLVVLSESVDEDIILDTMKQLLSIILQVAKGMAYLSQQKFVHRDLAARNCMISSNGVIKVADFGLAEDIYSMDYFKLDKSSEEGNSVKLPVKWMALESIHYGKFSEKSDVWSFGVLCWEVFSAGRQPYPGMGPLEVVEMLDNGERLNKPSNQACRREIYSLMLSCWNKCSKSRPSFNDLVEEIEELLVPLANYMDLNLLSSVDN